MKRNESKKTKVLALLAKKLNTKDIAKQVGCGVAYVYSIRHAEKFKVKFSAPKLPKPTIVEQHWIPDAVIPEGYVQISQVEHDMLIKNASKSNAYDSVRNRNEELEAQYAMCEEQLHMEQCKVFDLKAIVKYLEEKLNGYTNS